MMFYEEKKYIDEATLGEVHISRPNLMSMQLEPGVKSKLYDMFYAYGPGNGTALFMPFDQKSSEHGPGHEFLWADDEGMCADMHSIAKLVNRGNFSGYVLHPGNVRKYKHLFRPNIPLVFKLDGHVTQPTSAGIPSTVGTVEQALYYGAHAVGMTIYPGGEHIKSDLERASAIIREAHRFGLPAIVWSYPRGPGVIGDSLYWCHYAVALASGLLGADVVKTKFPKVVSEDKRKSYDDYLDKLSKKNSSMSCYKYFEPKDPKDTLSEEMLIYRAKTVVNTAPQSLVIFSGGPKLQGDATESLKKQTEIIMKAGAEGGIYGRNVWGQPIDKGLKTAQAISSVLMREDFHRQE